MVSYPSPKIPGLKRHSLYSINSPWGCVTHPTAGITVPHSRPGGGEGCWCMRSNTSNLAVVTLRLGMEMGGRVPLPPFSPPSDGVLAPAMRGAQAHAANTCCSKNEVLRRGSQWYPRCYPRTTTTHWRRPDGTGCQMRATRDSHPPLFFSALPAGQDLVLLECWAFACS